MHEVRSNELDPSAAPTTPAVHYQNATHGAASWFFTKDHKRIALLYLYSVSAFFLVGGIFAMLIRLELATPRGDLFSAETYNKAIELRPSYAHAYESRGSAYASKGVYTNAVADVTKATELARKKAPGPKTGAPKPPTKIAAKPAGAIKKTVENEAPDTWPTWAPFGAGKP